MESKELVMTGDNVRLHDRVVESLIESGVGTPTLRDLSRALYVAGAGHSMWYGESGIFDRCQFCGHRVQRENVSLVSKHEYDELYTIYITMIARRARKELKRTQRN